MRVDIPSTSIAITVNPDGRHADAHFLVHFESTGPQAVLPTFDGNLNLTLAKEPVRYYLFFPGQEWRVTAADGLPEALGF